MVLAQHQLHCLIGMLVIGRQALLGGHIVLCLGRTQLELDESDDGIVDDAHKLRLHTLVHQSLSTGLQCAYAACLDVYLVGQRRGAQYSPRRSIVVQLLCKQVSAFRHHGAELFLCVHYTLLYI